MAYTKQKIIAETDKFHVNNVQLLAYLDQARYPWYQFCKSLGIEAVLVHMSADFKKEVFNQEHITILTSLEDLGNTSFKLKQTMTNSVENLIIAAEIVLATINIETRTKTPLPQQLRELIHSNELL